MELGFTVKNAGPLSQLSLHILSLDTAVYLAEGAYGWWKARERSTSLQHVLRAAGADLVSTSSFNINTYRLCRQTGSIRGVVAQSGLLQHVNLPNASTAVPPGAGNACLRALLTCLLCFFSLESVSVILSEVLPHTLLQYDQEGQPVDFEGPLLASLRHLVAAVAKEEDANTFRQQLLHALDVRRNILFGGNSDATPQCDFVNIDDRPHVVGVLLWALTPKLQRKTSAYPTRSLRAWSIAVIMEKLGFEVSGCSQAAFTNDLYEVIVHKAGSTFSDVVLVTAPVGETDSLLLNKVLRQSESASKLRLTPLRGVPWLVFRRCRGSNRRFGLDYLVNVWTIAFTQTVNRVSGIGVEDITGRSRIKIETTGQRLDTVAPEFHRSLLSDWAIQLLPLCADVMAQFVPPVEDPASGWSATDIRYSYPHFQNDNDENPTSPTPACDTSHVIWAIVYGSVCGIAAQCISQDDVKLSMGTEIVVQPDLLYDAHKLQSWARVCGQGIDGNFTGRKWVEFLLEFASGIEIPQRIVNLSALDSLLGVSANGVSIVSAAVFRPSPDRSSLFDMHICQGQLVNVPINEEGFVVASSHKVPVADFIGDPDPQNEELKIFASPEALAEFNSTVRVDAEPCWEHDPTTVIYCIRRHGVQVKRILIPFLFQQPSFGQDISTLSKCICKKFAKQVSVPLAEGWQPVPIENLLRGPESQILLEDNQHILVDVTGSTAGLIAVLGTLRVRQLVVGNGCIECAYRAVRQNNMDLNKSIAIVMRG